MLLELHIKNFALIDTVDLYFGNGLNILTGETGAGKSIIIDSVNFIMGDKQSKDIIRTGAEYAYVEGVFDISGNEILDILKENGIDTDDVIVISREINQNARSISRINGRTVTVGLLKQVSRQLIDIHGQHQHQSLINEENHISILDLFCGKNFEEIMNKYKELYYKVKDIEGKIEKLTIDEQYRLRRMDLLSYQIQEITEAQLKVGEDDELLKQKSILSNAEKIYSALSLIYSKIYDSEDRNSAYDEIGTSIVGIESIEKYDEKIRNMRGNLEEIYYKLEAIVDDIRDYKDNIEFDPDTLNEIELRLDTINRLKMKYGKSINEILEYCTNCKDELESMENSQEIIEKLNCEKEKLNTILDEYAENITKIRRKTADDLGNYIEKELRYLGMEKAKFKVQVEEVSTMSNNGRNNVYFTMTANPGEPLKPLSKVASGGELSRIMLAIKSVIADVDRISTLIFDEIDTGISGRTAQSVAEKMCYISKNHQILCVTHLPQIASMADRHFKIEKNEKDGKTYTNVYNMERMDEIDELARMLGGAVLTDLTRKHAQEMKELADSLKTMIKN